MSEKHRGATGGRRRVERRLVIVGGGVSALWLALHAARSGIPTTLVGVDRFGGYASTGNQGWLHSGALYAMNGAHDLAAACRSGAEEVLRSAHSTGAGLTSPDVVGAFIPGDEQQLDEGIRRLRTSRIDFDVRDISEMPDAYFLYPGDRRRKVVVTGDRAIDTRLLVQEMLAQVARHGGRVGICRSPVRLAEAKSGWTVEAENELLSAEAVVLALGAGLPGFLSEQLPHLSLPAYRVTRSRVIAMAVPKLNTIVVPPTVGSPAIVPIWHGGKIRGVTICTLADNDAGSGDPADFDPSDAYQLVDYYAHSIPGLARLLGRGNLHIGMYGCQKLHMSGDEGTESLRLYKLDNYAPGLYGFYAGKMSSAPVAAAACLDRLVTDGIIRDEGVEELPRAEWKPRGENIAARTACEAIGVGTHTRVTSEQWRAWREASSGQSAESPPRPSPRDSFDQLG
ncbi:NAD(P)/FAD-dependent oxidoreductase [Nocardia gipuzkoensis]